MNISDIVIIEPGQEAVALILGIFILIFMLRTFKECQDNFKSKEYIKRQKEKAKKKALKRANKSNGDLKKWKWQ